jgi:hypothetical protein
VIAYLKILIKKLFYTYLTELKSLNYLSKI